MVPKAKGTTKFPASSTTEAYLFLLEIMIRCEDSLDVTLHLLKMSVQMDVERKIDVKDSIMFRMN